MKNNNRGFTLAELLIVVAIIAVLVAVAIPIFTNQLEKAREATDLANIRSAYGEVVVKVLEDGSEDISATVQKQQTKENWESVADTVKIGGIQANTLNDTDETTITYTASTGVVEIDSKPVTDSFVTASAGGGEGGGEG